MNKDYLKILLFRTVGNFLVFSSLLVIGKTFAPILFQELNYLYRQQRGVQTTVVAKAPSAAPKKLTKPNLFSSLVDRLSQTQEVLSPKDPNFSIIIPKIGANSRVIANVDSGNYEDYIAALKTGVAHARGTAFPGESGHIYLFAHSTDNVFNVGAYNAVFYLLYKLEPGDEIDIFYLGKRHLYKVLDKKVINPDEVQYLTRSASDEFLTLQTCWPPGTTLQRMLIFASPVIE